MTLSIERDDRRMGLASDRTVYSSKRNRPLLLYRRLLDDSRPSHGQPSPYRIGEGLPTTHPECAPFTGPASRVLTQARRLSPALHFRPEMGEGAEFRTLAKEDVDLFFQGVGVLSGRAHIIHVVPEALENLSAVVEDDHAATGVATRAPEERGLVAAEGGREAGAATEEIDGAGLAVVLGEDAAIVALVDGDAIPSDSSFVSDLFP